MWVINEADQKKLDLILEGNEKDFERLIPILQAVQKEFGFLSEECMHYISFKLKISLAHIYGVATFYTQFKFEKQGKYQIQVCRGTACQVKGGGNLLDYLKKKLQIEEKQTTSDGLFSLEAVNCVGACAIAPVMVINSKTYGNLTVEKIDNLLKELENVEAKTSKN